MKTQQGHLTYCTNIHAGESWPDHFDAIKKHFPAIKNTLSPNAPMGLGLRLSHLASLELVKTGELETFKKWLDETGGYVFTMNGFPYGGFHNTVVKDQVHAPDWTTTERLEYTNRLFDILAQLLPDGMDGGVSTSPLSYRYWFKTAVALAQAREKATQHIIETAFHLVEIQKNTGKVLHLDIEPEPDGILETGSEFIEWYNHDLLLAAVPQFVTKYGVSGAEAVNMVKLHIRLCYDVCHFAIGYEPHAAILKQLKQDGIKVGKYQISAALKALMPAGANRLEMKNAFARFNEPTYLHQVIARKKDGSYLRYSDLPEALEDAENMDVEEWRAHFHVPIFEKQFDQLHSTQSDIVEVLKMQVGEPVTEHLEVETYTWEVLSDNLKLPMEQSIIRELQWVLDQLNQS